MDISRNTGRLQISGKIIPNIGGGWNGSKYNQNDFVSRARKIGIIFQTQRSGHWKACLKDDTISDPLTISLHNPTTQAAKDMVRYVTKYIIIKLGYDILNLVIQQNRDFKFHQDLLFENTDDINFDKIKNVNINIDRNCVIEYIKRCFLNNEKINLKKLKLIAIKESK